MPDELTLTLENLMHDAIEDLNSVSINNSDSLYQFKYFSKLFLFKAVHICDATLAILQKHKTLYPEAYVMTRVLLEYYVSIQYMNKIDRIGLSERLYRYSDVGGYRLKENLSKFDTKLRKRFDNHPDSDRQKEECEKYMHDYGDNKQNRRYWSGKPLEQMADCISERWLYNQVYRYQCEYVHPGSLIMIHDLHMENNDIIIKRDIKQEDIDRIIDTCINLFSRFYLICDEVFGFKKEAQIESINIELSSLKDENKIKEIIECNKCPYCGESTIKKHNRDKTIYVGTDKEKTLYVYGCQNEFCIPEFYIPQTLFVKQQNRS